MRYIIYILFNKKFTKYMSYCLTLLFKTPDNIQSDPLVKAKFPLWLQDLVDHHHRVWSDLLWLAPWSRHENNTGPLALTASVPLHCLFSLLFSQVSAWLAPSSPLGFCANVVFAVKYFLTTVSECDKLSLLGLPLSFSASIFPHKTYYLLICRIICMFVCLICLVFYLSPPH